MTNEASTEIQYAIEVAGKVQDPPCHTLEEAKEYRTQWVQYWDTEVDGPQPEIRVVQRHVHYNPWVTNWSAELN